jgi:beta-fructofuranosidase
MTNDDLETPAFHVHPARGWLNDPHGVFHKDGTWHLFYQHNPADVVWGDIHWAHVSSSDLARWTEHPIALWTRPDLPDSAVCSTGTVASVEGRPILAYTATTDASGIGPVLLAEPADDTLERWNQGTAAVASPALVPGTPRGFRDPYFVVRAGTRYAVMTGGSVGGPAEVLLFDATDLEHWVYIGVLLSADDPIAARFAPADLWECPQLVLFEDRWVMVVSLWTDGRLGDVAYLVGDIEWGVQPRFVPQSGGLVDHGADFYAPTIVDDATTKRMWGWSWDADSVEDRRRRGTTGALSCPRLLRLDSLGQLKQRVDPALALLRQGKATQRSGSIAAGEVVLLGDLARGAELVLVVPSDEPVELEIFAGGEHEPARLRITPDQVELDRRSWPVADGTREARAAVTSPEGVARQVHLLSDGSLVEVFVDGIAFTERVYGAADGRGVVLRGLDGAPVSEYRAELWEIGL